MEDFEEVNEMEVSNDSLEVGTLNVDTLKNGQTIRNKMYAKIFDTNYYWDVPYLVDVEKYKQVMGKCSRMTDENTSTLRFSCEIWKGKTPYSDIHYNFDAFSNKKAINDDKWHYDNFQPWQITDDEENYTFDNFKNFVKSITECIIGIDCDAIKSINDARKDHIKSLTALNDRLNNIKNEYC